MNILHQINVTVGGEDSGVRSALAIAGGVGANVKIMDIFLDEIDKDNFFYNYITTMAYAQFGPNELFARGFVQQKIEQFPDPYDRQRDIQRYRFPTIIQNQIISVKTFTPLIFVPEWETKSNNRVYRMDPIQSANHFVADSKGITDVHLRIARMTIISAYEKVIDKIDKRTSVIEFFRHVRNAAAHNGKFHFTSNVLDNNSGDLKTKAEWKQFKIIAQLQDQPLFPETSEDQNYFWDYGDLVDFLLDFENQHPEIKNTSANNT